ncbi:MAG: hypothetical protein JSV96_01700 [Candidatus Aminicenantes bacterium]|nr:MAG: hypothetical protein JSV96_01700 [Candidatus Aminicenantes bacterium]
MLHYLWANKQKGQIVNNLSPDLEVEDLKVKINSEEAEIISLQKYFETGGSDSGFKAYIIQVRRTRAGDFWGKQTITVEYDKIVEIDGKEVRATSMGCFQFYLNFKGLSIYF